jgi:cell filamentation protein
MDTYSYQGSEDYCYPNTDVLINKLNIKNDEELSIAERDLTTIRLAQLFESKIPNNFDFLLLCNIHKSIFQDIYTWAGQIRNGEFFSKGVSIFCRGSLIKSNADIIFGNIAKEKYLCTMNKQSFISRTAYYMGEINALHPFREGNGRTLREYFRQLSLNAGYLLDFSKTNKEKLLIADINALNGNYCNLISILEKAISKKQ